MSEAFTIRVPGKLILCGEYAVIQGAPALCAAVARHATCTARPIAKGLELSARGEGPFQVSVDAQGGVHMTPPPSRHLALLQAALEERVQRAGGLPTGFAFNVDSAALTEQGGGGAPVRKLGLGSSSAATVALTAALDLATTGGTATAAARRQWFESACRAQVHAQGGLGSGADAATSAMGSVILYRLKGADPKDAQITRMRWEKLGVRLLAVWTGTSASTVERVRQVQEWMGREPAAFERRFREMAELAEEVARAVDNGDRRGFLSSVDGYGEQMALLGQESGADIVGPVHQKIRQLAAKLECVAKPSGAGGGDVAVCFCPDGWAEKELSEELVRAGLSILPIDFDAEGAVLVR